MSARSRPDDVDRWESQMRKGGLELAVLATLWEGRSLYGLEILRRLDGRGLEIGEGTLYPLLNRLRRDALVATDWVEGELGHPRKYYRLTATGRDVARSMASRWRSFNATLGSLLEPLTGEDH